MCITLVEDKSACYTWDDLEYFQSHQYAFTFNEKQSKEVEEALINKKDSPRVGYDRGDRFFHIKFKDYVVGELWTYKYEEPIEEVFIRIFEEYQRKGYGNKAISYYLDSVKQDGFKIIAACNSKNPLCEHIIKMLEKCGFEYIYTDDGGYYQYIEK